MGQKPAEIEREIADRREAVTQKLHAIDERVRRDVDDVRHDVRSLIPDSSDFSHAAESAKDTAGKVATGPDDYLLRHPAALVGAAVGAGFLLDRMVARDGRDTPSQSAQRHATRWEAPVSTSGPRGSSSDNGSGDHGSKLGVLASLPMSSKVQDTVSAYLTDIAEMLAEEGKKLIKDATDSLRHELFEKPDDDNKPAAARQPVIDATRSNAGSADFRRQPELAHEAVGSGDGQVAQTAPFQPNTPP